MPVVSVIIPVHNSADTLRRTFESAASQTLRDIEIILAENLSSDGSSLLCDELAASDERAKALHLDKAGLSHARNCAIMESSSPFVAFLDSDDFIEPDMLEKMYGGGILRYNADVAVCNFDRIYPDGKTEEPYASSDKAVFMSSAEMTFRLLKEEVCSSACTGLYRKSLFGKDGTLFPEDRYFEDRATTWRLVAGASSGCVWIPESLYHYVQRSGSISHTMDFVKYYHHALADLERLEFVNASHSFDASQSKILVSGIASSLLWAFENMIAKSCRPDGGDYPEVMQVRQRILKNLARRSLTRPTHKKKLWQIRYLWPFYCRRVVTASSRASGK